MKKEFNKVTQRKLQTNNNIDENSLINIDVNSQENGCKSKSRSLTKEHPPGQVEFILAMQRWFSISKVIDIIHP